MITVVVDGYNVIHAIPQLAKQLDRSLQDARTALVGFCRSWRSHRGDVGRLYVVFDGSDVESGGPREDQQGVTVIFTHRGQEADERILSLIRAGVRGERFLVVSDDTQLTNNARAHGAGVLSASAFCAPAKRAHKAGSGQADSAEKTPLSLRDANRITEEYRKRLML